MATKTFIVLVLGVLLFGANCFAQCPAGYTLQTVYSDGFEYTTTIPGIDGTKVYHTTPQTSFASVNVYHSGTYGMYMNVQTGAMGTLYKTAINNVCVGGNYELTFWSKEFSAANSDDFNVYVEDNAGTVIASLNNISQGTTWTQYTINFTAPSSTIYFEIYSNIAGSNGGNDICFDDLALKTCLPDMPTVSTTAATCAANGTATVTNYDATATYTFSPVGPAVDATGLISGVSFGQSYTVTADFGGCTSPASTAFTVDAMLPTPTMTAFGVNPTTCGGNGVIDFTFTNVPDGSYTISYDTGTLNATVSSGTATVALPSGNYNNLVITVNGCSSAPVSVSLTDPTPPPAPVVDTTAATCNSDGTATITNYDASATYTFVPAGPTVSASGEITNAIPGTAYTLSATVNGCSSSTVSFTIQAMFSAPLFTVASTNPICLTENGTITITPTNNPAAPIVYSIGNGVPDQTGNGSFSNLPAGNYTITVSDGNGCVSTNNAILTVDTSDVYVDAFPDEKYVFLGTSVDIKAIVNPNSVIDSLTWYPTDGLSCGDCTDLTATPDSSVVYYVTVVDEFGCVVTDSVVIHVKMYCGDVFVPNTFSPNADGNNDFQCVYGDCIVAMEFSIYNRWGETVFHSADQKECWNGKWRGKYVQSGAFAYQLKAVLRNGKHLVQTGSITVVR